MALGEFDLIKKYFTDIGPVERVALGVGDDCAVLDIPADQQLATSVDTLVADVHFPANGDPDLIAQKALRSNLSDLAASGAQPLAFTLALTLSRADEDWLAAFARGLRACADEFSIPLIGGDTTRSSAGRGQQLVITIQVMGTMPRGQALLRSGAQVGDLIYVSGTLGAARAALEVLNTPSTELNAQQKIWLQRYYTPSPRIALGIALRDLASAAIDISDGLAADLGHILDQSGVGAILDAKQLPLSPAIQNHPDAQSFALHGGDDYELCFTVPHSKQNQIAKIAGDLQIHLTAIGEITATKSLQLRDAEGGIALLRRGGYQHF